MSKGDDEKLKPNIKEALASGVTAIVNDLLAASKYSEVLDTSTPLPEDPNHWVAGNADILGEVLQDVEFMSVRSLSPESVVAMLKKRC